MGKVLRYRETKDRKTNKQGLLAKTGDSELSLRSRQACKGKGRAKRTTENKV